MPRGHISTSCYTIEKKNYFEVLSTQEVCYCCYDDYNWYEKLWFQVKKLLGLNVW